MTRTNSLIEPFVVTLALLAWALVPARMASGTPLQVRETLRNDLPSRAEYERMERGYYEQILDTSRRLDAPVAALPGHAESVRVEHGRLTLEVNDVREFVLRPNLVLDPGRGIPWSTNSHAMRDREYPLAKPANTFRIALVGDSIATGWGVRDGEGFEPRLETTFNERSRNAGGPAVEILNFAVPGHGPGQRWCHFDQVGWAFSPDLVIYEATTADPGWDERRLRVLLARGIGFVPIYQQELSWAGIGPGLAASEYKTRLRPLRWALLGGVYRAAASACKARGVPVIWVLIPRVGKPMDPVEREQLVSLARESGFSSIIDASDAYDGADQSTLAVAPNDFHPNAEGHARIARRLDDALSYFPELSVLMGVSPR